MQNCHSRLLQRYRESGSVTRRCKSLALKLVTFFRGGGFLYAFYLVNKLRITNNHIYVWTTFVNITGMINNYAWMAPNLFTAIKHSFLLILDKSYRYICNVFLIANITKTITEKIKLFSNHLHIDIWQNFELGGSRDSKITKLLLVMPQSRLYLSVHYFTKFWNLIYLFSKQSVALHGV